MSDWTKYSPADLADVRAWRARWVRRKLAALPQIEATGGYETYAANRKAVEDLAGHLMRAPVSPARITDAAEKATVAMLGIRATSTTGLQGALQNWCARVEKEHGE